MSGVRQILFNSHITEAITEAQREEFVCPRTHN